MKNGAYFEHKRKYEEFEFKRMLKKHLPEMLAELMSTNRNRIISEVFKSRNVTKENND